MFKKNSGRGKYLLVALLGAVAGGSFVALTTRAVPKAMSGMCEKMHQMMAEGKGPGCEAEGICQRMMAGKEQTSEQATCGSSEA